MELFGKSFRKDGKWDIITSANKKPWAETTILKVIVGQLLQKFYNFARNIKMKNFFAHNSDHKIFQNNSSKKEKLQFFIWTKQNV